MAEQSLDYLLLHQKQGKEIILCHRSIRRVLYGVIMFEVTRECPLYVENKVFTYDLYSQNYSFASAC
jgi:hypothetical protein